MSEELRALNKNIEKMTAEFSKLSSNFRTFSQHQYGPSEKKEGTWYGKTEKEREEEKTAKFRKKYQEEEFRRLKNEKMFLDNQKIRMLLMAKESAMAERERKKKLEEDEREFKRQQAIRELRLNKYRIQYDNIEKAIFNLRVERERKHMLVFKRNQLAYEKFLTGSKLSILTKPPAILNKMFFGSLSKIGLISPEMSKSIQKFTSFLGTQALGATLRASRWLGNKDQKFFSSTRENLRKNRPRKTNDYVSKDEFMDGVSSGSFTESGTQSQSGMGKSVIKKPLKQEPDGTLLVKQVKDIDYNRTDDYMRQAASSEKETKEKEKSLFDKLFSVVSGIGPFLKDGLSSALSYLTRPLSLFAGRLGTISKYMFQSVGRFISKIPFLGNLIGKISGKLAGSMGILGTIAKPVGSLLRVVSRVAPVLSGLVSYFTTEGGVGRKLAAGTGSVLGMLGGGALGTFLGGPIGTFAVGAGGSYLGEKAGTAAYDWIFGDGSEGDAKGPSTIHSLLGMRSQLNSLKGIGFNLDASRQMTGENQFTTNQTKLDIISSLVERITGPSFIPRRYGNSGTGYAVNKNATLDGVYQPFKDSFLRMSEEYSKKTGKPVGINSGFRTYSEQARLHALNPSRAARPGMSAHEYGYAIDINSATANELDSLGLLSKYGMRRPVRGEPWHIEPEITQSLKAKLRAGNIAYSEGDGAKTEVIPRKDGGSVVPGKKYIIGEDGPEVLEVGGRGYVVPKSTPQEISTNQVQTRNETPRSSEEFKQFLMKVFLPEMAAMLAPSAGQFVYSPQSSSEW